MKTIVFTVCSQAQYPFAEILKASLPTEVDFRVGLVNGQATGAVPLHVVAPEVGFAQNYDETALMAASKPFFSEYFLKEADAVIYFDPTVQVLGAITPIIQTLQTTDILLTPRLTKRFGRSLYGDEKLYLNSGMYDTGFWGLRRSPNTQKFLKWLQNRMVDRAYFDLCHGMNHDQLWLNYVPIFFDNVLISKNIGWNVALHNLHERVLTHAGVHWYVNQSVPLIFMNFKECFVIEKSLLKLTKTAGATPLIEAYQKTLQQRGVTNTSLFSLYQSTRPKISGWKKTLRRRLQSGIEFVQRFPLYH